jgi:hypothetical protein
VELLKLDPDPLTGTVNVYELYRADEWRFSQCVLRCCYNLDCIFTGMTLHAESLDRFSTPVKEFLLMHILIDNTQQFMGPFRYSKEKYHLQLHKDI